MKWDRYVEYDDLGQEHPFYKDETAYWCIYQAQDILGEVLWGVDISCGCFCCRDGYTDLHNNLPTLTVAKQYIELLIKNNPQAWEEE